MPAVVDLGTAQSELAEFTRQRDVLASIRAELAERLLALSGKGREKEDHKAIRALELSILVCDGRYDSNGAIPIEFPLFALLKEWGVTPPPEKPWNPFAGLRGHLPALEAGIQHWTAIRNQAAISEGLLPGELWPTGV